MGAAAYAAAASAKSMLPHEEEPPPEPPRQWRGRLREDRPPPVSPSLEKRDALGALCCFEGEVLRVLLPRGGLFAPTVAASVEPLVLPVVME